MKESGSRREKMVVGTGEIIHVMQSITRGWLGRTSVGELLRLCPAVGASVTCNQSWDCVESEGVPSQALTGPRGVCLPFKCHAGACVTSSLPCWMSACQCHPRAFVSQPIEGPCQIKNCYISASIILPLKALEEEEGSGEGARVECKKQFNSVQCYMQPLLS